MLQVAEHDLLIQSSALKRKSRPHAEGSLDLSSQERDMVRRPKVRMPTRKAKRYLRLMLKCLLVIVVVLYGVVPLVMRISHSFQHSLIFLTFVNAPFFSDLSDPERFGLLATRNFYIYTPSGVKLGAWHVLPADLVSKSATAGVSYEQLLDSDYPVVLYMHGNSGSRANSHRVELYTTLQQLNVHVLAFDYRGYADSTAEFPTEETVVKDAKAVFHWLRKRATHVPIIVWGHSLGTGVATRTVYELCSEGSAPNGLILESPFNNLMDEVRHHPLTVIYKFFPMFDWFFIEPLRQSRLTFESDKYISGVCVPIVIMHAVDDNVVPFELGYKLYQTGLETRGDHHPTIQFIRFEAERRYGHRYIARAPEIPDILRKFLEDLRL